MHSYDICVSCVSTLSCLRTAEYFVSYHQWDSVWIYSTLVDSYIIQSVLLPLQCMSNTSSHYCILKDIHEIKIRSSSIYKYFARTEQQNKEK